MRVVVATVAFEIDESVRIASPSFNSADEKGLTMRVQKQAPESGINHPNAAHCGRAEISARRGSLQEKVGMQTRACQPRMASLGHYVGGFHRGLRVVGVS